MGKDKAKGKKVVIIGAGPGGLTAAMLLAHKGFDVTVYEKEKEVGGRNAELRLGDYRFDTGPTFLMMKFVLDEMFQKTGRRSEDYLKFVDLDPMYVLDFDDKTMEISRHHDRMKAEIARLFPGEEKGLDEYIEKEARRYERLFPCLQLPYSNELAYLKPTFIKAIPTLEFLPKRSLFDVLGDYFGPEKLRLAFTFQAKYLGMSPWECPGAFAIISFVEHKHGVFHVIGGLSQISHAMAKVVEEEGGRVLTGQKVRRVLVKNRVAKGVELESGEKVRADAVIINADFGHAMTHLFKPGQLRKYSKANVNRMRYSCSIFMMYLGVKKEYDLPHHKIFFAKDYKANLQDIFKTGKLSQDSSFYIRDAGKSDPTLAPKGKSALYILVPVPNNKARIDWKTEKDRFAEHIIDLMVERAGLADLRENIEVRHVISPDMWESDYAVKFGATFNLGHYLSQMLTLRPHNEFEEVGNVYLAGGGTHPGSGLPTIYESGRISAELIQKKFGVEDES